MVPPEPSGAPGSPPAWDRLDTGQAPPTGPQLGHRATADEPPATVFLFAACWADLVAMVAVATAALLALVAVGHRAELAILPWAGGVALCWWWLAASATVAVRRGTPGMLLAGLVCRRQILPRRVQGVVIAALVSSLSLGLLALLGPRRSLVAVAAGSELVSAAPSS